LGKEENGWVGRKKKTAVINLSEDNKRGGREDPINFRFTLV